MEELELEFTWQSLAFALLFVFMTIIYLMMCYHGSQRKQIKKSTKVNEVQEVASMMVTKGLDQPSTPTKDATQTCGLSVRAVCNELCTLKHKYYQIGIQLGITHDKIKEFEKEVDPLAVIINYWLKGNIEDGACLSWMSIVAVLKSPQVDELGIADKINQMYCHSSKDTRLESHIHLAISSDSSSESDSDPPPVNLDSYFPYLSLEERKNSYHLLKLKDQTDEIKRSYGHLISKLKRGIEASRNVKDVIDSLTFYNSKFSDELKNCTTMDNLFSIISKQCSFYNFSMMKFLIKEFGSNSLKSKMRKYKQKFQDYAKRRVCECPSNAFGTVEGSERVFRIKTEEKITSMSTIDDLQMFEFELNKILGQRLLRLLSIEDGCIELTYRTFSIYQSLAVSEEQKEALRKVKVIQISYGGECFNLCHLSQLHTNEEDSHIADSATAIDLASSAGRISKSHSSPVIQVPKFLRRVSKSPSDSVIKSLKAPSSSTGKSPAHSVEIRSILFSSSESSSWNLSSRNTLKLDSDKLLSHFTSLVFDIEEDIKKLHQKDVLSSLNLQYHGCENLFTECLDFNDLFSKISKWYSFFDYGLIKYLAKKFGSSYTKIKMRKYEQKFKCFAKCQVCECPRSIFGDTEASESVYKIKVEQNIATLTLLQLAKLKSELKRIIGCKLLRLLSIEDEITFRAFNLNITEKQHQDLKKRGIVWISSGDKIIFAAEQKTDADPTKEHPSFECDSAVYTTRESLTYNSKLSDVESSFTDNPYKDNSTKPERVGEEKKDAQGRQKEKDLLDPRIDMIISAEAKLSEKLYSPINEAIVQGNLAQVESLIKHGENPMVKDANGDSCLHLAVKHNQFSILKYLIEEVEIPPGITNSDGATVLHIAAETELATIQYLVESEKCKLDPTFKDSNGYSALYYACRGGNVDIVRYLIESTQEYMTLDDVLYNSFSPSEFENRTRSTDDYTRSPLCCACFFGHLEIVKYLIEDCNCDFRRAEGSKLVTPIESATSAKHFDIVKYLKLKS